MRWCCPGAELWPGWLPDDVVTATLETPASGGAEPTPLPDDIKLGTDRGGPPPESEPWADDEEFKTPRAEAREYNEFPDKRFDWMSEYEDLAVSAGSGK